MRKRVLESLTGALTEDALYKHISHNRLLDLDYKFSSKPTLTCSPSQEFRYRERIVRGGSQAKLLASAWGYPGGAQSCADSLRGAESAVVLQIVWRTVEGELDSRLYVIIQ